MSYPGPVTPVVGMGATLRLGSDAYPYTIVYVSPNGKTIHVVADEHGPNKKTWPDQDFDYTPGNGPPEKYSLRKNGRYHAVGSEMATWSAIHIGSRRYYQDPSF
jgi:hypothetical protein